MTWSFLRRFCSYASDTLHVLAKSETVEIELVSPCKLF